MKLADMEVRLQSARLLNWKAAMLKDAGENFTKVCWYSKLKVSSYVFAIKCDHRCVFFPLSCRRQLWQS